MQKALKVFPPVFVKLEKGIRYWQPIITNGGTDYVVLTVTYGWARSRYTVSNRTLIKGKNIGKSNETTPLQQAIMEVKSKLAVMKRSGYQEVDLVTEFVPGSIHLFKSLYKKLEVFKDYNGIPNAMRLHHFRLPTYQKGTTEYKKSRNLKFPAYLQRKVDGVFCTTGPHLDGLYTRDSKDRLTPKGDAWKYIAPQVWNDIQKLKKFHYIFNGEMYFGASNLQVITSACQKKQPVSSCLRYCIFDVCAVNDVILEDTPYSERLKMIEEVRDYIHDYNVKNPDDKIEHIEVIGTHVVDNLGALYNIENYYLTLGEEGVILRDFNGVYRPGKRSSQVLKLVRMDSSEVLIVDIVPMDKEPTHGIFVCKMLDVHPSDPSYDIEFRVTPSNWDHNGRVELLDKQHRYVGKKLTISHRGYTNDGIPRIATGVAIKEI